MDNNLHKGHRERIRKKFANSADSLLEHEILELLLFYPIPRKNTNHFAHILINKFGNLNNVLSQPIEELIKSDGMGESTALFLNFIHDLCNEYNLNKTQKPRILSVEDNKRYFANHLKNSDENECLLIVINDKLEIESSLSVKMINFFKDASEIKRITDFFMKTDCKRVIAGLKINDPNSNISQSCFNFIYKFKRNFLNMDIVLMDCIVCNRNKVFSMCEKNVMS